MSNPEVTTGCVGASPVADLPMPVQRNAWVLAHRLPSRARERVLWALLAHVLVSDSRTTCWPSQTTLAAETEMSVRTVSAHLTALEAAGIITRERRQNRKGGPGGRTTDLITLVGLPAKTTLNGAVKPEGVTGKNGGVKGGVTGNAHAQTRRGTTHLKRTTHLSQWETLVADLLGPLGIERDDERISFTDKLLMRQNVRTPGPWLRKAAENGDLLGLLEGCRPKADPEDWMNKRAKARLCTECRLPDPQHATDCSMLPCDECTRSGGHFRDCSKRPIRLCAGGCGQEVSGAAAATLRPCRVCHTVTAMDGAPVEAVTA